MIRKDDLIMDKNKDFAIEELARQCEEAKKNFETLNEQLQKARQEEENKKRARLAHDKETRKKEVEEAIQHAESLVRAYTKDYGVFSYGYELDDYGLTSKHAFPWWF
jgi:predicted RNase H-like nuclease (RuvC/YqgF family)